MACCGRLHDGLLHVPRDLPDLPWRVQGRRAGRPPRPGQPLPWRPGASARVTVGDGGAAGHPGRSRRSLPAGSTSTAAFGDFINHALPELPEHEGSSFEWGIAISSTASSRVGGHRRGVWRLHTSEWVTSESIRSAVRAADAWCSSDKYFLDNLYEDVLRATRLPERLEPPARAERQVRRRRRRERQRAGSPAK